MKKWDWCLCRKQCERIFTLRIWRMMWSKGQGHDTEWIHRMLGISENHWHYKKQTKEPKFCWVLQLRPLLCCRFASLSRIYDSNQTWCLPLMMCSLITRHRCLGARRRAQVCDDGGTQCERWPPRGKEINYSAWSFASWLRWLIYAPWRGDEAIQRS